jgi:hypothetical protein
VLASQCFRNFSYKASMRGSLSCIESDFL